MPIAVTEAITTLAFAEQQFNLHRTEAPDFFPEWRQPLPELPATEQQELRVLQQRYLYQRSRGHLLEGTVLLLLASPLLALAGFYDPPFQLRAEESVRLTLGDEEEDLHGRLDILVVADQLWVVVEFKKMALSVWSALPQTLAYLQGTPSPQRPSFGLMTNGDEFVFVKLARSLGGVYDLSRVFALFAAQDELQRVLRMLKHLGQRF